jgi:hypothetical protein
MTERDLNIRGLETVFPPPFPLKNVFFSTLRKPIINCAYFAFWSLLRIFDLLSIGFPYIFLLSFFFFHIFPFHLAPLIFPSHIFHIFPPNVTVS